MSISARLFRLAAIGDHCFVRTSFVLASIIFGAVLFECNLYVSHTCTHTRTDLLGGLPDCLYLSSSSCDWHCHVSFSHPEWLTKIITIILRGNQTSNDHHDDDTRSASYPTGPFTVLVLQHPWIEKICILQERRESNIRAPVLCEKIGRVVVSFDGFPPRHLAWERQKWIGKKGVRERHDCLRIYSSFEACFIKQQSLCFIFAWHISLTNDTNVNSDLIMKCYLES